MKRLLNNPSLSSGNPWIALASLFGIPVCENAQEFEHQMLKIREPVIFEAGGRDCLSREVQDVLEAIQQKSDCVYVIWDR